MLEACLLSLCRQTSKVEFEVLVVDNGSTDATQEVIKSFQSELPTLTGLFAPEPGLHVGRHEGMKAARGEVLVFADDDIEALPTWLTSIDEAFKDPSVVMVGGNNYPMFMQTPPEWLRRLLCRPTFRDYRVNQDLSVLEFTRTTKNLSPLLVFGCNFSIRKNVLLDAGGFHPDGMPIELIRFRGDGETHVSRFVAESGLNCVFHPGASVYHKITPERMTHAYFRKRGFHQGVSDSYTQLRRQYRERHVLTTWNLAKRLISLVLHKTINMFDSAETKKAFELRRLGWREGFAFHQAAYRSDPEVHEWVHRPIYY